MSRKLPPFLDDLPESDAPWIVLRHKGWLVCLNEMLPPMEVCAHGLEYMWIKGKKRSDIDAICTKGLPDICIDKFMN